MFVWPVSSFGTKAALYQSGRSVVGIQPIPPMVVRNPGARMGSRKRAGTKTSAFPRVGSWVGRELA